MLFNLIPFAFKPTFERARKHKPLAFFGDMLHIPFIVATRRVLIELETAYLT
jgi:hypothetical protein